MLSGTRVVGRMGFITRLQNMQLNENLDDSMGKKNVIYNKTNKLNTWFFKVKTILNNKMKKEKGISTEFILESI